MAPGTPAKNTPKPQEVTTEATPARDNRSLIAKAAMTVDDLNMQLSPEQADRFVKLMLSAPTFVFCDEASEQRAAWRRLRLARRARRRKLARTARERQR